MPAPTRNVVKLLVAAAALLVAGVLIARQIFSQEQRPGQAVSAPNGADKPSPSSGAPAKPGAAPAQGDPPARPNPFVSQPVSPNK